MLRLFAAAREAAGVARAEIPGTTVAEMLEQARAQYGERFSAVLSRSRVWVNGEPASAETVVHGHDVVAVLPPVSGGAGEVAVVEGGGGREGPQTPGAGREGPVGDPHHPRPAGSDGAGEPRPTVALAALGGRPTGQPEPETTVTTSGGAATGPSTLPSVNGPGGGAPGWATATLTAPARTPHAARPGTSPTPQVHPEGLKRALRRLAVTHDSTRPHGRIGLLWAVVTVAFVVQGQQWLAGWLAVNAFAGGSQAAACRRALEQRPQPVLAALIAAGAPIAAVAGARYAVGVVGCAAALAVVAATLGHGRSARDLAAALAIGALIGAAAAGPVITRDLGIAPTLFLLACVATYDAGAYLVGTGASSLWEGPVAGIVALIPITLIGAIILSPPFPSGSPLALGALAGVLAPVGPLVGTALVGSREANAPGLRRLDSLIVLGPVWAWWATSLLR